MCSVSGTTSTYVFVPVLCCDDDAICFLRSIFDAAAGQAAARMIRDAFSPIMIDVWHRTILPRKEYHHGRTK
jgi:hypothetical protein